MANYQQLKQAIADVIKTNGTKAITGQVLQDTLNSIVSVIGANYTFAGIATPSTNPSTPDQNVFYFATEAGIYSNFGGISITERSLFVFLWNGTWTNVDLLNLDDYYQDLDALVTQFEQQLSQMLEGYQPIVIEGDVTNAPDEEDLTSVGNLLRLKNRNTLYGMGCIYLRRELGFAEQLTQENTIYVIRYDYTLTADVTIPANCVLKFDGGNISAGSGENMDTITGNNTGIQAGLVKIFNTDVTLAGSWNVVEAYPEWFGAKFTSVNNEVYINKCLAAFNNAFLHDGEYIISSPVIVTTRQVLRGTSKHRCIIRKNSVFSPDDCIIKCTGSYINIEGIRLVSSNYNTEYGILFGDCEQSTFKDIYVYQAKIGFYHSGGAFWGIHFSDITVNCNTNRMITTDNPYGYASGSCGFYLNMKNGGGSGLTFDNIWTRDLHIGYRIRECSGIVMNNVGTDHAATMFMELVGASGTLNSIKVEDGSAGSAGCCFFGTAILVINCLEMIGVKPISSESSYLICEGSSTKVTIISSVLRDWEIPEGNTYARFSPRAGNGAQLVFINSKVPSNNNNSFNPHQNGARDLFIETDNIHSDYANLKKSLLNMKALHKGNTESRPSNLGTTDDVGFDYFDTTLGKPIYWTGTAWVDATGASV